MPLHLIKLAVGARTPDDIRAYQAASRQKLRHSTRNFPRRAAEILDGGSIYWVVDRIVSVRQSITDIVQGDRALGSKGCDLMLDPRLVRVRGRFVKPFQGWRYLSAADAPADEPAWDGASDLPAELRRDLARLGLV